MFEFLQTVFDYLNYPFVSIGEIGISALGLVKFAVVFWVGFYLGALFRRRINRIEIKTLSGENRAILANLGYYAIAIGTIIVGLTALGINLSSLAVIAGAVSVGVGFGLQNIVSNFISGIILMFEKTIRVGDLIELPSRDRGRVTRINMRSTIVTTANNIDIIVPNQTFITQNIINLTLSDNIQRISVPFGVAYGSDIDRVKRTVLDRVTASALVFVRDPKYALSVRLTALGASSLDFVLVVYISVGIGDTPSYEYDFLPLIYDALNEAKIAIPYPQLDVHFQHAS
ncbi:mechanosensitive ion channel protein MscS [Campylobacterota bacterium]|nr:mechanosensitive ion channel protein MscS [Campylobacterota bacterium]